MLAVSVDQLKESLKESVKETEDFTESLVEERITSNNIVFLEKSSVMDTTPFLTHFEACSTSSLSLKFSKVTVRNTS